MPSKPIPGSTGEVLTSLPSPYLPHPATGLLYLPRFLAKCRYVKAHGALYHEAAKRPEVARALLDGASRGLGTKELSVVGPPRGALLEEALSRGLRHAREGFADRAYRADGTLVPRSERGALLVDLGACTRQAIALAATGTIETICVHADTVGAVDIAAAVRDALVQNGYLAGAL